MEISITDKRKGAATVYYIVGKTDRKAGPVRIDAIHGINAFFFGLLDQFDSIEAMALCQLFYCFRNIHDLLILKQRYKLIFYYCHESE